MVIAAGLALKAAVPAVQAPAGPLTLTVIDVNGISRHSRSDVIALSGLHVGQTITPALADAATNRLSDTGLFTLVSYKYQTAGSDLHLTFDVVEEAWTMPMVFDNFVWFADDELARELRQGVPTFDGTAPANAKASAFFVRQLQNVLDRRGIHGRVEYAPHLNIMTGAKAHVFIVKDAGAATRVCAVTFDGASQPLTAELSRAASLGGSEYSRQYLDGLVQGTLTQIYRRRGYLQAHFQPPQLTLGGTGGCAGVAVTLKVVEGLRYVWDRVHWSGNATLSAGDLDRVLALGSADAGDSKAIQDALARVHALYDSRGYLQQSATSSLEFNDKTQHAGLAIVVVEGAQFRMGALTFSGFTSADEAALRKSWRLRSGDVFDGSYPARFVRGIAVTGRAGQARPAIKPEIRIDPATGTVAVSIVLGL